MDLQKATYWNDGFLGPAVSKKVQYLQHNWGQNEDSFYGVQFNFKLQFLTIFNERPKAAASRQDHKMQFENFVVIHESSLYNSVLYHNV